MKQSPPAGPPWDLSIDEADFAFVDLEMTGLNVENDHIVEVCVHRVRGNAVVDRLVSLVKPEKNAGGAAHIHGIGEGELQAAPRFNEIAPKILSILKGTVFVAHGAKWDLSFLHAEMARTNTPFSVPFYLDTLTLSRRAFSLPNHSLDALCNHFGIDRGVAHRAEADVVALREVFKRAVDALSPSSVRDLWQVRIGGEAAREAIVAALTEAVESKAETTIHYRPSGKSPQILRMIVTQVRSDIDPPRVIGYLVPGRSRRELRTDRILHVDPSPPR